MYAAWYFKPCLDSPFQQGVSTLSPLIKLKFWTWTTWSLLLNTKSGGRKKISIKPLYLHKVSNVITCSRFDLCIVGATWMSLKWYYEREQGPLCVSHRITSSFQATAQQCSPHRFDRYINLCARVFKKSGRLQLPYMNIYIQYMKISTSVP